MVAKVLSSSHRVHVVHRRLGSVPYLPPVRAERERVVAIARAELDQLTPPGEALPLGTYSSIDLGRGAGVDRNYSWALPCQELHTYYADTLARAGWTQWKAPYDTRRGELVLLATYHKQAQGVSLKLILDCSLSSAGYTIRIIQPDFWNNGD
jgi:hypothetical protein